jgi:glycosyltransferase involved in cell wall biosynthesis
MPIKVLHVTFDMTIGGTQQVIRQLVENMDQKEIHSEIACIDGTLGELGEILLEQGVSIHILKRQPGFDTSLIKTLFRLIRANHYDVIHCHQYTPYVYGLIASILTTANVIFTEHGRFYPDYGTWKRKFLNPVFNIFTYKITTISYATKDALVKYENFKANKINVIYNGIKDKSDLYVNEAELKKKFKIPKNTFVFGTISRLQPIKNQALMINAFKNVHDVHKDTHLLIVGDGEIRSNLEQLVKELHLIKNVTFTGFQKDPYCFNRIMDVFLLTSYSEGTSMTLLEAMSFSIPAIVSNVGGNPEIIKHLENGLVFENFDKEQLKKLMCELIEDRTLHSTMSQNVRKNYISSYTITRMCQEYLDIYS